MPRKENLPHGMGDLYAAQTVGVGFYWFRVKARHHDCTLPFYSTAQHRETYIYIKRERRRLWNNYQ